MKDSDFIDGLRQARELNPKPLVFDPAGDNRELLDELRRRHAANVRRGSNPEVTVNLIDLLTDDECETAKARSPSEEFRRIARQASEFPRLMARVRRWAGSKSPKHLRGVQALVDSLVANHSTASAQKLWDLLPPGSDAYEEVVSGVVYEIYRDGDKLVQFNHSRGRERAIKKRAFQNYVARSRK